MIIFARYKCFILPQMKKVLLLAVSVLFLFVASGCKKEKAPTFTMKFDTNSFSVNEMNTIRLSRYLVFEPASADTATVTWTSSNEKVATVDKRGVVLGIYAGKVTITATTSNGQSASCEVEVKEVKIDEFYLMGVFGDIFINERADIDIDYKPLEASLSHITWKSSVPEVMPKYDAEHNKWYIETGYYGEVDLTAVYYDKEDGPITVSIDANVIKDIIITPDVATMMFGQTKQLTAEVVVTHSDNPLSYPENFEWRSDNTSIVTVDENGLLTAQSKVGSCNVICTHKAAGAGDQDVARSIEVRVTESSPLEDFTLDKSSMDVYLNQSGIITVLSVTPSDANPSYIEWSTSDPSLVTLAQASNECTVKAGNKEGKCTVTASCNGVRKEVEVIVRRIAVTSITMDESKVRDKLMFSGGDYIFTFKYAPADASLVDDFQLHIYDNDGKEADVASYKVTMQKNGTGVMTFSINNSAEYGSYSCLVSVDNAESSKSPFYILTPTRFYELINKDKQYGAYPKTEKLSVSDIISLDAKYLKYVNMTGLNMVHYGVAAIVSEETLNPATLYGEDDKITLYYKKNTTSPYYSSTDLKGELVVTDAVDNVWRNNFTRAYESQGDGKYEYIWKGNGVEDSGSVKEGGTISVPRVGNPTVDDIVFPSVTIITKNYNYKTKLWDTNSECIAPGVDKSAVKVFAGQTKTYTMGNSKSGKTTFNVKYAD